MKRILAALAVVIGMSSAANAGIMIEPYLGYEIGDLKYQFVAAIDPARTEYTDSTSGTQYGLRLGYKFILPWVALDYSGGTSKAKPSSDPSYDLVKNNLGAVVGVNLPLIRAWAGYGFTNDMNAKSDDTETKYKGTYIKAGVGLGIIPLVSLNLEYKINELKKIDLGAGGGEIDRSVAFDSLKYDTIMLSVSLPFDL